VADGKVYLTSRDGVVSVVRSGPKFELLAANKLPDQMSASPAIAKGRIYLRGFEALYAIGGGGEGGGRRGGQIFLRKTTHTVFLSWERIILSHGLVGFGLFCGVLAGVGNVREGFEET